MVLVCEIEIPWIHTGAEFFTRPFPVVVGKARGGGDVVSNRLGRKCTITPHAGTLPIVFSAVVIHCYPAGMHTHMLWMLTGHKFPKFYPSLLPRLSFR